jgi:2-dehydro-3-deoxygalactonokinase
MTAAAYSVVGDWGTTRMRLFRIAGGAVVDRVEGTGIGALEGSPAQALLAALAPWRREGDPEHVVLCGMAGARIGLVEAPYADCPSDARAWSRCAKTIRLDGIAVAVAAGLACVRADGTPDVMRGEETQIFGALCLEPALAGGARTIALPGTHGKWARIENGRVLDFHSFPSGELYALLRDRSTLTRVGDDDRGEDEGFAAGLERAHLRDGLLGHLFVARSAQLRQGRTRGWALGFLSGLIIGSEVEQALASHDAATAISLIGDPQLCARYRRALEARGAVAHLLDGDACAVAGLRLFEENFAWT